MTQHLAPGRILCMSVVAHAVPLLYCPMASADGAGDSASQGSRFDLQQDVADQGHHLNKPAFTFP